MPPIDSPATNTAVAAAAQLVEGARRPRRTSPARGRFRSCQRVPWPGSSGQRTVKPAAARCSAHGRMLCGVPVKPWHEQHADVAAVVGERLGSGQHGRLAIRGPPRGHAGAAARIVARQPGVADSAVECGRHRVSASGVAGREGGRGVLLGPQDVVLGPLAQAAVPARGSRAWRTSPRGAAILASNHLSFSDSIFLPLVVAAAVTFLAKAEYFTGRGLKGRLTAAFFKGVGQVPVDRSGGRAGEAALDTGLRILRRGRAARHLPRGHPLARRPALPRQDRRGPDGAGDRRPGHPGRDDRHRQDPAARQGAAARSCGSASGSASRWTSPATRAWRTTASSCARSPTRSCTR